jgi:hypothetical protein
MIHQAGVGCKPWLDRVLIGEAPCRLRNVFSSETGVVGHE